MSSFQQMTHSCSTGKEELTKIKKKKKSAQHLRSLIIKIPQRLVGRGKKMSSGSIAWNLIFRGWTVRNWMFNISFVGFFTFSPFQLEPAKVKKSQAQKLSFRNVPFQLHNCLSYLVSFLVRFNPLALTSPHLKAAMKKVSSNWDVDRKWRIV